jgi:hypothetical protein
MKFFVIPVIAGATEIVTKGLKKYLETIPGKHSIDSLQKKNSCTRNITHYKESATVRNLSLGGGVYHRFKRKSTRRKL